MEHEHFEPLVEELRKKKDELLYQILQERFGSDYDRSSVLLNVSIADNGESIEVYYKSECIAEIVIEYPTLGRVSVNNQVSKKFICNI